MLKHVDARAVPEMTDEIDQQYALLIRGYEEAGRYRAQGKVEEAHQTMAFIENIKDELKLLLGAEA